MNGNSGSNLPTSSKTNPTFVFEPLNSQPNVFRIFQVNIKFKNPPLTEPAKISDVVMCPVCSGTWFYIEQPNNSHSPIICNNCLAGILPEGIIHFLLEKDNQEGLF